MFLCGAGATQADDAMLDEFLQLDAAAGGGAAWSFDDAMNDPTRLGALPPFPALDDGRALRPAATPAGGPALRCLEAKHAAGCTACTPPPAPSQESHVVLSVAGGGGDGTDGSGRGLNALRAALLLSPEWNSSAAREDAAVALEAALAGGSLADLPAVLRAKRARALKKGHLIALCRHWRYRSDVWQPKGNTCRKRVARTPPSEPAASAAAARSSPAGVGPSPSRAPSPALPTDVTSVQLLVTHDLVPLLVRAAAGLEGRSARVEAVAAGRALFNAASVRNYSQAQDACAAASRRVVQLLAMQRALSAELLLGGRTGDPSVQGSAADAGPAWLQLALHPRGAAVPVDEALGLLRLGFGSATRMTHAFRDHWRASAPPGAPIPAIIAEMLQAESDALCYAARAAALLATLAERAPLHIYLAAAVAVLSELAVGTRGFELALGARAAWAQDVLKGGGVTPLPSTFADEVTSTQYLGSIMTITATAP